MGSLLFTPFGAKLVWIAIWLFFWWLFSAEFVVVVLLSMIAYKNLFPED